MVCSVRILAYNVIVLYIKEEKKFKIIIIFSARHKNVILLIECVIQISIPVENYVIVQNYNSLFFYI